METTDNGKLKKLLLKLLNPEFEVKNEMYLSSLLDHLKDGQDKTDPKINQKEFMQWLKQAVLQWENSSYLPPPNILSFSVKFSIIYTSEEVFVKLNSENIIEKLIKLIKKTISGSKDILGVKLNYINLLSSFLNHKSGVHFIISTNYWSQIIDFILNSETIYIRKGGCRFIANLLQKSVVINEWFSYSVIQALSSPLQEAVQTDTIQEEEVIKNLSPTLCLLNQVFANLLEICGPKNDVKIFRIVLEKFAFEKQIRHLKSNLQNEEIIFEMNKIMFTLAFYDFILKLHGKHTDIHLGEAKVASQKLYDVFLDMTDRGPVTNFLKLLYVGLIYCSYIRDVMPKCKTPESITVSFETQLMSLQVYPVVLVNMHLFGVSSTEIEDLWAENEEMKEQFLIQMTKYLVTDTFRTSFKWKNYLQQNLSLDLAAMALKYMLQSMKLYTRDTGMKAFQMMVHCLTDIRLLFQKQPQKIALFAMENNCICILLETLTTIINDFEITWQDCIESICVLNLSSSFLSYPVWSSKVIVRILKLMEIAIAKYMSPNMALLVDNADTVMNVTGPILYAKTHDSDWEVRDSTLELIRTICHFTKKFPSLRKTILDAEFPSITFKIAKGDMEPYVRATAYKCLQEMVETNEFWNNLLGVDSCIVDYLIRALHQESEGIVRKEIATLISVLYEFQELPECKLDMLYDIMSHAVIIDLYWEVKVKALDFWNKVLEHHLMDQGVIDGIFPKITFSKENRKIVTLNEVEIKRRLVKVLNQLSKVGCLAVFIAALQDDCDVEVSKKAVIIIKKFVEMLKQYNITNQDLTSVNSECSTPIESPKGFGFPQNTNFTLEINHNSPQNGPNSPQNNHYSPQNSYYSPQNTFCPSQNIDNSPLNNCNSSQLSPNNVPKSKDSPWNDGIVIPQNNNALPLIDQDSIIDEILNAQDLKLLETVYNSTDELVDNSVEIKTRKMLSPDEFLNVVSSNFEDQAKQKTQWIQQIDSFNSLLDDILSEYERTEINSMDCY